jgi:DNA-binding SARP family transcriptional activator
VSDERLKTALWPDQAPKTATFNTAISTTRSGLGRDSSGEPHFSHFAAANRRYRLGARATSDYARFAARVEHARSASADAAVADLRSALELVRGQPFAEIHGFEWAWSEGFVATIETAVAKAAHDLAQRYLERGDPDGAIWAAMRGLVAAPADEILYRDRMIACDLAGNPAGVETVMRELQHAVEAVEPWDGIHPETIALYQHLAHGRRATSPRA